MRRGTALRGDISKVCLRDEWCIHLVELIDADRKRTVTSKGWQPVGRTLIGDAPLHFPCYSLHAFSANRPNDVRQHRTGSCCHYLRDAVQAVVAMNDSLSQAHPHRASVQGHRAGRDVS